MEAGAVFFFSPGRGRSGSTASGAIGSRQVTVVAGGERRAADVVAESAGQAASCRFVGKRNGSPLCGARPRRPGGDRGQVGPGGHSRSAVAAAETFRHAKTDIRTATLAHARARAASSSPRWGLLLATPDLRAKDEKDGAGAGARWVTRPTTAPVSPAQPPDDGTPWVNGSEGPRGTRAAPILRWHGGSPGCTARPPAWTASTGLKLQSYLTGRAWYGNTGNGGRAEDTVGRVLPTGECGSPFG